VAIALAAVGLTLAVPLQAQSTGDEASGASAETSPPSWDAYHRLEQVDERVDELADRAPELVRIRTIGESAGGKDIRIARVAAEGDVDADQRPALFVGANISGYHNAGTEAALHLLQTLIERADEASVSTLLSTRTFYIAPALNPDAHDAMFDEPRHRRIGNAMVIDRDRDGFEQEDPPNDVNGDGRITMMRIEDPEGTHVPDTADARVMVPADRLEGQRGRYRVLSEGGDDDGDGRFNEDGPGGVAPNMNFAHNFPFPDPEAGPWSSYAPETRAVLDFVLEQRNIAAAIVYGPANNLLSAPRGSGSAGDLGTMEFELPTTIADFLDLDPEEKYTLDEVWEVAKDLPFVVQNDIQKEQLVQFIGVGPATAPNSEDLEFIDRLADAYKERLEEAGFDTGRSADQYGDGGLTPWLYYQAGLMAIELDVWGPPKPASEADNGDSDRLTIARLEEMSSESFLELSEEVLAEFLERMEVSAQFTAESIRQRVEQGMIQPAQMARMLKASGKTDEAPSEGSTDPEAVKARDLLAWVDANAPELFIDWTPATLPDGTEVEIGGVDPFAAIAPPDTVLERAVAVHTDTALDLAEKLARAEIVSTDVEALGGGLYRVTAVARNTGYLPTNTRLSVRARTHIPPRLEIAPGRGVTLVNSAPWATTDRIAEEAFSTEWLVQAGDGSSATIELITENAGTDETSVRFQEGQ
jgi:hypothetical protein